MAASPSTPFRIPVSDLLQETGRRRAVVLEATVDWRVELSRVDPETPLVVEVSLESLPTGLLIRGSTAARMIHSCHRCVTEWAEEVQAEVAELLGTDPDDEYRLDGDVADIEDPVRDAVLLTVPLVPMCREDCAGLCSVCGADLNTGTCPGHEDEPDTPFAALRGLLEP
jgi:uncharacterized protein